VPAKAKQAGPDLDRSTSLPIMQRSSGLASPRLTIDALEFSLGAEGVRVSTTLAAGRERLRGTAAGSADENPTYSLAAAATVDALQQHLEQCGAGPSTPLIQLLDVAVVTTGIGQEAVSAVIALANGARQEVLLGSALVRNDRPSTAVAAVLDAVTRRLSRHWLSAASSCAASTRATSGRQASTREDDWGLESLPEKPLAASHTPSPRPSLAPVLVPREPADSSALKDGPQGHPVSQATCLGVTVSATSIRAAAVDPEGVVVARAQRPTRTGIDPDVAINLARQAIREIIAAAGAPSFEAGAIGIAIPGHLRTGDGICVSCGEFPTWREVQIVEPFAEEFHLPVHLVGTAQAAALAEATFGAAEGLSDVLYVRLGVDIDVAVIVNHEPVAPGQLLPGQAGHIVVEASGGACACGEPGCWQSLAGRDALVARVVSAVQGGAASAVAAGGVRPAAVTPAQIVRAAAAGDVVSRSALEETGRYLAIGLANLITFFSPQAVIVDIAPASLGPALLQAAETALKSSPRAKLLASAVLLSPELGDSAQILGAAAWAARRLN
jgi:glucokinase